MKSLKKWAKADLDASIILGILTLLTTIAGFVYTWMKDARDRKWQIEDAAMKSLHLSEQDRTLADNRVALEEGKQQAVVAYTEANATNAKIANLQQQIRDATGKAN